jgi:hypothetical protein
MRLKEKWSEPRSAPAASGSFLVLFLVIFFFLPLDISDDFQRFGRRKRTRKDKEKDPNPR